MEILMIDLDVFVFLKGFSMTAPVEQSLFLTVIVPGTY